jgi:enoyl-CoA hydratase/carnithine racemase
MKALTRVPIFSYNTLATTLIIPTKSLEIKFRKNYLSAETLFELESILAWSATHSEVQSLFITSYGEEFVQGFDPSEIKTLSEDKLKKLFSKVSTIAETFLCLPQTVVVDMKKGTRGVGLELALAADVRIAKGEATFCFDHLSQGLTPTCGLFSFLRPFLNQNVLRSLLLSGTEFGKESFLALGGWCEFDKDACAILTNIFNQAPIARMQAKSGLYGIYEEANKVAKEREEKLFNATVHAKDYAKTEGFMSPAEYKEKTAELRN